MKKKHYQPFSNIDGSKITSFTPRQRAMHWWNKLTPQEKGYYWSSVRSAQTLTGREIEIIYNKQKYH